MTISLTTPVTGAAQTGLTSPTYTHVVDTPPNAYTKQYAVTALGGTQTGVDVHGRRSHSRSPSHVRRPLGLRSRQVT